jgi:hypothetical protein
MNLHHAKACLVGHIAALKTMCLDGTPWVFLCAAVVIECLSKLAAGKDLKAAGFKSFIRDYMPVGYRNFKYQSGKTDLPDQLYYVLRCGIVHNFSMVPGTTEVKNGARIRSVVMSHDEVHLSRYTGASAPDACCLRADGFVADIETATNKLFSDAEDGSSTGDQLAENIEEWLHQRPPIKAIM